MGRVRHGKREDNTMKLSRRSFLSSGATAIAVTATGVAATDPVTKVQPASMRPFVTPDADFVDVSRGKPKPHSLTGEAQIAARLTPESWRLEISADAFIEPPHTKEAATLARPLSLANGTALDMAGLMELGREHEVHFFKAMQCLNINTPLGQGLWTGVPLREVLRRCGASSSVRRIYFWGYHNQDPKQVFKSSVSYTQCMETAPGDLPVFLAYRLNGQAISPERGGPVRMIVPWSHGYKSIKWLQHIFVTNDARNNDTYAEGNNDPDSFLKTAAYIDEGPDKIASGEALILTGQVISGLSGVRGVEYWLRKVEGKVAPLADTAPELQAARWTACELDTQPKWSEILPTGIKPERLLGFDRATGLPQSWPPRYGMCSYSATIKGLRPGHYEVRARSIDLNGYAQPEPRPSQKSGKNAIQVRRIEVV
jgi:DMSO/TMAO reductase YedYZ molybdopterin-dependent catalytic subunit